MGVTKTWPEVLAGYLEPQTEQQAQFAQDAFTSLLSSRSLPPVTDDSDDPGSTPRARVLGTLDRIAPELMDDLTRPETERIVNALVALTQATPRSLTSERRNSTVQA